MFHPVYLDERIALTPGELNIVVSADTARDILLTKLREKHEGKCNANGYVRPGSIQLLARSMGTAENGRFTGNLLYDCKIKCEILYLTAGSVMEAHVIKVNKMGAYAVYEEAVRVLLPRDLHIGSEEFDAIKEGDMIQVRVERSRFQANDPFIMAVGKLASALNEPMPALAPAENALPALATNL
jgi:DNA-directed RNA polymerase subunit E'/Rpb7